MSSSDSAAIVFENGVRERHRLARPDGAELELVAGEGERARAVAVARVARKRRQGGRAEFEASAFLGARRRAALELLEDVLQLLAEEDRQDGGRRFVGAEAVVVRGARHGGAQKVLVAVDGAEHGGAHEQELHVLVRRLARLEQIEARVGAHRPVVVLARSVDARERLLVHQADEPVARRHARERHHEQLLVVGGEVARLEDRRDLVLARCDLVVARLDRHAEPVELGLDGHHVAEHALGDRAEVVVLELLPARRLRAEERPPGEHEVRALPVVRLVHEEVFLLAANRARHRRRRRVAEEAEHAEGGALEGGHRAQERDLVVERLAGPRREGGRDGEVVAARGLDDEGRAGRVPRGVAARFERRPEAARGERRRVRLALNELLARELGDGAAALVRRDERVVLLGGGAGERLEPVRVVARALGERPLLHRERDRVGDVGGDRRAVADGGAEGLEGGARQARLHLVEAEGVLAEDGLDVEHRGDGRHVAGRGEHRGRGGSGERGRAGTWRGAVAARQSRSGASVVGVTARARVSL